MKLKMAIFELTGCGGCELTFIMLNEKLEDILELYDIAHFKMISSREDLHKYDVAVVTGSVSTERDLKVLESARKKSRILLALGTCAVHGGPQSLILDEDLEGALAEIYGKKVPKEMKIFAGTPISEYVKVDVEIPGCPPESNDLFQALVDLAHGVVPYKRDYPVCLECKINETECVLVKRGIPCLGPITLGGCNAVCINLGIGCIGCRGPLPEDVNIPSEYEILKSLGISEKTIKRKLRMFSKRVSLNDHEKNLYK